MTDPSQATQCDVCPDGNTTKGAKNERRYVTTMMTIFCPGGIIAFGMVAVAATWMLSFGFHRFG